MTSELRHAIYVWRDACIVYGGMSIEGTKAAVAVIEADREAVRAEQAAELAKWKALAETLAGALERIADLVRRYNGRQSEKLDDIPGMVRAALERGEG